MKKVLRILITLVICLTLLCVSNLAYAENYGNAENFTFVTTDDESLTVRDLKGSPTILIFGRMGERLCGNTNSYVESVNSLLSLLSNEDIYAYIFEVDDSNTKDGVIQNTESYENITACYTSESYNSQMWKYLKECGIDDNRITLPCVFYINSEGEICDYSTGYLAEDKIEDKIKNSFNLSADPTPVVSTTPIVDENSKKEESTETDNEIPNSTTYADDNRYYNEADNLSFNINGVNLPIKGYEIGKPWDNCWTFANIVYEEIWGINDGNNMLQNLEQDDLKITEENVERFISDAEPGANIRVEDGRDVNQHSMILVEKDNKGFTVYHGNMNGGIYFTYYTYEGFAEDFSEYRYFAYVTWPKAHEYAGSSDDEKFSFVYTVKFDTNSGSDIDDEKVSENSKLEMPEDPQKDGYEFGGWFTDEELTTKYNSSKKVTESFTLYAKWIEEENPQDKQIILTVGKRAASVFGKTKSNDVAPKIVNDRTMLPARFVAESLGANVEWVSEDKKVRITKGDTEILIFIGSNKAKVNGKSITLDSPAFIEDERTYTPIRFICEELGATVDWNGETQEITITQE